MTRKLSRSLNSSSTSIPLALLSHCSSSFFRSTLHTQLHAYLSRSFSLCLLVLLLVICLRYNYFIEYSTWHRNMTSQSLASQRNKDYKLCHAHFYHHPVFSFHPYLIHSLFQTFIHTFSLSLFLSVILCHSAKHTNLAIFS